jgi:hypothetical protein
MLGNAVQTLELDPYAFVVAHLADFSMTPKEKVKVDEAAQNLKPIKA